MLNYVFPQIPEGKMISLIKYGLEETREPKKIIILGAGMAGLVAASLLKKAGHHVTILEAANRIGGKVYTLREGFTEGHYLEAGAMRFPKTHLLTLEYVKKFKLPTNDFLHFNPHNIIYIKGKKVPLKMYEENSNLLNYPVYPHEKGKTATELIQFAIKPITDIINQNPRRNWPWVIKEFDKYSMDLYLRYNPFGISLSPGAVEKIRVLLTLEGLMELSFLEQLRHVFIPLNPSMTFYEITGGNDKLPNAFTEELKDNIQCGQKVKKIVQHDNQVTVQAVHKILGTTKITGDIAIVTIPFTALQFIDVEPRSSFSENKWKAIREIKYAGSTKTGIQFKSRFWEKEEIYGGQTITDLPIKYVQYPSNHLGSDGPGVILGSYTWEDDAILWDSLDEDTRIKYVLKNLAEIHGNQVYRYFQGGASHSWIRYPYSAGAFTMFKPGQITELTPHISSPEGRVHLAGEHTSTVHAWIQGAIESGIRVASEVNHLPRTYFSSHSRAPSPLR